MKKLTIELMQQIARDRGGKCLSKKYINAHTHLEWICAEGHPWSTPPMNIRSGKWCKICGNKRSADKQRGTLKEMQDIASEKNGKCISKEYINARTHLEWMCAEGHRWFAVPESVKGGTWCKRCSRTVSEEICRTTFEQIFNSKFNKWAPKWLRNPKGNQMTVDGYNKHFNIAFEYQGEQHYKITRYTETEEKLKKQKSRDRLIKRLLKKHAVNLIVINYRQNLVNLPLYIERRTKAFDLNLTEIDFDKKIDFNKVYLHKTYIEKMQGIAAERGGKCLSTVYINARTHLDWMCSEGHPWKATPDNVKRGTWCRECYERGRINT